MSHLPENTSFQQKIEKLQQELSAITARQQEIQAQQNVWEQALLRAVSLEDLRILLGKGRKEIDGVDQHIQQVEQDLSSIFTGSADGVGEEIDRQIDQFFSSVMGSMDSQDNIVAQVLQQWPLLIGEEEQTFHKRFEERKKQGGEQDLTSLALTLKQEILWERMWRILSQEHASLDPWLLSQIQQKWIEIISSQSEGDPEQLLWNVHDRVLYENIEGHVASQWPLMTSEEQRMVQQGFFDLYPKQRSQDPMALFCLLQRKIVFQRSLQALQQQGISVPQQLLPEFERLFIARRGDKPEKTPESVLIEIWFDHLYAQYVISMGQEQYFTPEERINIFLGTKDTMSLKKIKDMEVAFLFSVTRQIVFKTFPKLKVKFVRPITDEERKQLVIDFCMRWKESPWKVTLHDIAKKMHLLP